MRGAQTHPRTLHFTGSVQVSGCRVSASLNPRRTRSKAARSMPVDRRADKELSLLGGTLDPLMPNSMRHGDRGCDTVLAGYSGWHLIRPRRAAITMRLPFGPKGIRANQTNRHKLRIARGLAALQISVLRPPARQIGLCDKRCRAVDRSARSAAANSGRVAAAERGPADTTLRWRRRRPSAAGL
jgi:hypothetical protein